MEIYTRQALALLFGLVIGASCVADDHLDEPLDDTVQAEMSEQERQIETAIDMMRAQGAPEAQIEEFRQIAAAAIQQAPALRAAQESMSAAARTEKRQERVKKPKPVLPTFDVQVGENTYKLRLYRCEKGTDIVSFGATGLDDSDNTGPKLYVDWARLPDGMQNVHLKFTVGGSYVGVEPAPWDYENGVYRFSQQVQLNTPFGPTTSRQQRTEIVHMAFTIDC